MRRADRRSLTLPGVCARLGVVCGLAGWYVAHQLGILFERTAAAAVRCCGSTPSKPVHRKAETKCMYCVQCTPSDSESILHDTEIITAPKIDQQQQQSPSSKQASWPPFVHSNGYFEVTLDQTQLQMEPEQQPEQALESPSADQKKRRKRSRWGAETEAGLKVLAGAEVEQGQPAGEQQQGQQPAAGATAVAAADAGGEAEAGRKKRRSRWEPETEANSGVLAGLQIALPPSIAALVDAHVDPKVMELQRQLNIVSVLCGEAPAHQQQTHAAGTGSACSCLCMSCRKAGAWRNAARSTERSVCAPVLAPL